MTVFDPQAFRQFVGLPVLSKNHHWGVEERYVIPETALLENEALLKETLYHHHSSFDFFNEIAEMGFPLAAKAIRHRNSGNPTDKKTQMAHLGEVFAAEFARAFLGFETTIFPKRMNPNIDQSMKGADLIGLRNHKKPPELLIGEAKSSRVFDRGSIDEAYAHLCALHKREASRMLRFAKEVLSLQGDGRGVANVERHMADDVPRQYIVISLTQSEPQDPFSKLGERAGYIQLPHLLAVHIQIQNLRGKRAANGRKDEGTWLSKLFAL